MSYVARFRRYWSIIDRLGVSLPVSLRVGRPAEFPKLRDYAYCKLDPDGVMTIVVAPKMRTAAPSRVEGVLMHEFGHAYLFHRGRLDHTERDADRAAEELFGAPIGYDRDDVQTSAGGVRPRPARLDARTRRLRRNGSRSALVDHLVCTCGMSPADAERIAPKKDVNSPRRALSPDQLQRFKATVRRVVPDPAVRSLLLLLPATGMRVGEACALSRDAIGETRRGRLRAGVVGKGDKPRTVALGREGSRIVRAYLGERPASTSDRVFVGPKGGKITPAMVQAACRDVADALGEPGLTPHVLRHTYATHRVLLCRDLEALRVQLGHGKLDGRRKTKRLPAVTMTYLDF